jgi:hypothetical protein
MPFGGLDHGMREAAEVECVTRVTPCGGFGRGVRESPEVESVMPFGGLDR